MNFDPASFVVNLFLYYFENKWLLDCKKRYSNKQSLTIWQSGNSDNLCAINDNNWKDINISGLGFQEEKNLTSEASFLDLLITIKNKKTSRLIYLIREIHSLSLKYMLDLDNNIPSNMYNASIDSEILRFVRLISNSETSIKFPNHI